MMGGWGGPVLPEGHNSGVENVGVLLVDERPARAIAVYEALTSEEEYNDCHIDDDWNRAYDLAAAKRRAAWEMSPFALAFETLVHQKPYRPKMKS